MKTSSAKAKGRRAAQEVKDLLLEYAQEELKDGDIVVTSSGETGPDLKLSPSACDIYPIRIECKNQEALNIWSSLKQAESHIENYGDAENAIFPILAFKRNNSRLYGALPFRDLVFLLRKAGLGTNV